MNNERIEKNIEDALNSFDGASKAEPKPYLFTRLTARMNNAKDSAWERAGKFIARPVVVVAGLCLVLALNATVLFNNASKKTNTDLTSSDEFSTTMATLYNFENAEQ